MSTSRPAGAELPRSGVRGCSVKLELLALQLPPVVQPEDPDRAEVIALRSAISQLITEVPVGLADSPLSCAD